MPLNANSINAYGSPKTQLVRKRFFGFVRKVEHKIMSPQNINRTNQFGLASEQIDFFVGSSQIKNHYREFFPRKGITSQSTTEKFSFGGAKKIIREKLKTRLNKSEPISETSVKNYTDDKKLLSEAREYSGTDKYGAFNAKMTTTYDSDYNRGVEKPKVISVYNEKNYISENNHIRNSEHCTKTTVLFDENGKKNYKKIETPTRWKSVEFDEKGIPFNHDSGTFEMSYENYSENLI